MKIPIRFPKNPAAGMIAIAVTLMLGTSESYAVQQQSAQPQMQGQAANARPRLQCKGRPTQGQAPMAGQPPSAPLAPEQLQQLVAPIALYPDALVAQILAASTYPTQIVEAERFLQQSPNLTGVALGAQVDQQDWDPSVKALVQFPSVLADLDKNLS